MQALVQTGYGALAASLRVEERTLPRPGPGEVRVRVRAAGVNPLDWKLVEGHFKWMSKARPPCGVGFDLAGEVHAAGPGAMRHAVGARVAGLIPAFQRPPGAYAQFALVPQDMLVAVPASVPLDQAAALPVAGLSALQMVRMAKLSSGRRVLVHGAAGGVGHLAVQIARNLGALVTATASAPNQAFLRSLRPARTLDYRAAPVSDWGGPFDAVLDCATTLLPADVNHLLADDGRYVSTTPRFPQIIFDTLANLVTRRRKRVLMLRLSGDDLQWLIEQLATGQLQVFIERSFPLAAALEALQRSRSGRVRGKLVIEVP
jgi:NADPH:quinone reductase-like Zn-dependent oxidoreductase